VTIVAPGSVSAFYEDMDIVIATAAYVKYLPAWVEANAGKTVRRL
jgi:hypothetical protein